MNKTEIKFGTDGFRGIIAREFTFCTVERIIKAIALYLRSLNSTKNTVIVGYDPRFMARDFALFCAKLLKDFGFQVILSSCVAPTPVVAYNAKYYPNSIGAIMLTASHNPKEYQGIKFIPDYAGPATKEITNKILEFLDCEIETKKTVIVGYDPRFMARDFALFCTKLLKDFGFQVILSSCVVPTPIVAYNAKYYPDSIGAIMLTASHNPKEYQGIKFIPDYAGPATKEITNKILEFLDCEIETKEGGQIIEKRLDEDYIAHLEKLIDFETIKQANLKIIYDGLYSSSISYFDKILDKYKIDYKSYNMHHSSDFGGGLPEPKPKFLKHVEDGYITVANDGDADRYGVIDEKGNYISPNIVLALLLKYLVSTGKKGKMIKTVGVSNLVDVVAKKLNIETITTPVGFKWLGEKMRQNETILAGEDSGGLSIGAHIPEKDGLLANFLILEMMAKTKKTLAQLVQEIKEFAGCEFYTDRVDLKLKNDEKVKSITENFSSMDKIMGLNIKEKMTLDGIKFFLGNGLTSLLIRKSGTEALLRFYIESNIFENIQKMKDFIKENA